MADDPIASRIYKDAANLSEFVAPTTSPAYADVLVLGRFDWFENDTTPADNINVIAPSGGIGGRWKRSAFALSDANPQPGGASDPGVSNTAARADHVHSSDIILDATRTGAVSLADSSETLTLSTGRRRSAAVSLITASRTKTLSVTGAKLGDLWTIERSDTSRHRLTVLDAGGAPVGQLDRPGILTARFNGAAWVAEVAPSAGRTFTPQQFGFKFTYPSDPDFAAQVTANTAAINAMFAAASPGGGDSTGNMEFFFPSGDYYVNDELRLLGNGASCYTIRGEIGGSAGLVGTRILASSAFPATGSKAVMKWIGVCGSKLEDIELRAQFRAKYAFWGSIETGSESSSNLVFQRVTFAEARNEVGARQCGAGPEGALLSGATQFDNCRFYSCIFVGTDGLGIGSYSADGFGTNVASNTKNFSFFGCLWAYNARHIDWLNSSGPMTVTWGSFESSRYADVRTGGSKFVLHGGITERGAKIIESSSAEAAAELVAWQWNGATIDDTWEVGTFRGHLSIRACDLRNYRADRVITSVDAGGDTITVTSNPDGLSAVSIPDGRRFRFAATNGATLPGGVSEDKDYYAKNAAAHVSTFQFSETLGGAAVNMSSAGSGTLTIVSESRISGPDDLGAGSLYSIGNWFYGSMGDHAPLANAGIGNDPLGNAYAYTTSQTRIHSHGDRGGVTSRLRMLRGISGLPQDVTGYSPYVSNASLSTPYITTIYEGRPDGNGYTSCYELPTTKLRLLGGTSGTVYIQIAPRTQVRRVVYEVEQALAASGLATATLQLQDVAAGDVLASRSVMSTGVHGLAHADLGVRLSDERCIMHGAPSDVDFAAAGSTVTRNTGSWVENGFKPGMVIRPRGTASNDAWHTLTAVTDTVLTTSGSPAIVDEAGVDGATFDIQGRSPWVQGGYMPFGGWTGFGNILMVFAASGANFSALTAGRIRIYVTVGRYG
jgi:hypothetical protein